MGDLAPAPLDSGAAPVQVAVLAGKRVRRPLDCVAGGPAQIFAEPSGQPIDIRLALPPAAAVLVEIVRSTSRRLGS
jgi:hypothetical protein